MTAPTKGDVKLGTTGDLRDYRVTDIEQITVESANPLAPKLNTGGKYAELATYAEWVQDDWTAGVGKADPNEGGFLYAELDSRVSKQLILPQALGAVHTWPSNLSSGRGMLLPNEATTFSTVTLSATGSVRKYAVKVVSGGAPYSFALNEAWFLVRAASGQSVTLHYYDDSSGPGTSQGSVTVTSDETRPIFQWLRFTPSSAWSLTDSTTYWVSIEVSSGSIELACGNTWEDGAAYTHNGTAWAAPTAYPFFVTDVWAAPTGEAGFFSLTRTAANLYAFIESGVAVPSRTIHIATYDDTRDFFAFAGAETTYSSNQTISAPTTVNGTLVITGGATIVTIDDVLTLAESLTFADVTNDSNFVNSPAVLFDGNLYLALGDDYATITASTGAGTNVETGASCFLSWNGYLWRAYANALHYTSDGSTWGDAIKLGTNDYVVRGLAGLDRSPYAANDEGFFMVGEGDLVMGLFPWGAWSDNQIRMLSHQGAIYIPSNGRILRYTSDGTVMDVWISRDDDLPSAALGYPYIMAGMNNWLTVGVNPAAGSPTAWAFQDGAWHFLAALPPGCDIGVMYYDRAVSRLWLGTKGSFAYYLRVDDAALNPYNSSSSVYMPYGWIETPKFSGDLIKLDKDFESVFIAGEFDTGTSVAVYYQSDQDSTWQLLGTVTADGTELRWSDYTVRPTGKWIRLGLLLSTTDITVTPRVQAVVVKYLPMITDRERWVLPIVVADNQEMRDGTLNVQTAAQQLAHLKSLVASVSPVTYVDVDGTEYEVKITGAGRRVMRMQQELDGTRRVDWLFNIAIEEM